MIAGIDHVVIALHDLDAGIGAYETLLGHSAAPLATSGDVRSAVITTSNISVELMAPAGEGEGGQRLRAALEDGGEGLKSLVFRVDDIARTHLRCERVGLKPEAVSEREAWSSFRLNTDAMHGVRVFCLQRAAQLTPSPGAISGLDHVVVRTSDPERAAALYGARLGLDMRLDREIGGRRLMFFRCGDTIVEIVEDPSNGARDRLWGLSWRVASADIERERLANAGLNVLEVRTGMKPGTRVFTVRDRTCGVPTLMIEQGQRRD